MRRPHRVAAACCSAAAFALDHATLLPGFDFGDTASFQVMAGSRAVTPRDGYPLYFALGRLFAWLVPHDPAYALNLASAAEGAAACGLLYLAAWRISVFLVGSLAAVAAFAGSYTFWSQSVIAEVYGLHICVVAGTLWLLLRWEARPNVVRLASFFAVYALGFGNHLSTILLLPVYAGFLLWLAPGGWRTLLAPRIVGIAAATAALGALQYAWNLRALWLMPQAPASLTAALATFWFDVTKSDWRDTMVLRVPAVMAGERLRMYVFDVGQQFGWLLPLVAALGGYALARVHRPRALLLLGLYVVNVAFALGYNVGDAHVFFLPSHLMIALLIAPGVALLGRLTRAGAAAGMLVLGVSAARMAADYPALDWSGDRRPDEVLSALSRGLDDRHAVLLTDMNWQVENGLTYFATVRRPELAVARLADVLLYAPALVRDNADIGREVVLTERAAQDLAAAYGPLLPVVEDRRVPQPGFSEIVREIAPGTRYVLCLLRPSGEFLLDRADVSRGLQQLTGGAVGPLPPDDYVAVAGLAGSAPAAILSSEAPFRRSVRLDDLDVRIRMESWLAFDTIRRMGFGQIVAGRRHTLIVERGLSFATFDETGAPRQSAYLANIFAPQPRYLVTVP